MIKLWLLTIVFGWAESSNLFHETADEKIEKILGNVENTFSRIDVPDSFAQMMMLREIFDPLNSPNETDRNQTESTTVGIETTTDPRDTMSYDDIKMGMRKFYVMKMLDDKTSPMPDFNKETDGMEEMSRMFKHIARNRTVQSGRKNLKPYIKHSTPKYFEYDEFEGTKVRHRYIKTITMSLMEQFIYMAQYKMPYLLLQRNKYKNHLKYKIGFCFALLRLLLQQQRIIYTTLDKWTLHFNSLMIHIKMYEKVVRLDVDIRDICAFIRVMSYKQKILERPYYYIDWDQDPKYPSTDPTSP